MFKLANDLLEKIRASLTTTVLQPCIANVAYSCGSNCSGTCDGGCSGSCTQHCLHNTDFW